MNCQKCGRTFVPRIEAQSHTVGLCRQCFKSYPLKEGEDFVMENGLMVFTRAYHLKRAYCCGSGCRNCPYGD